MGSFFDWCIEEFTIGYGLVIRGTSYSVDVCSPSSHSHTRRMISPRRHKCGLVYIITNRMKNKENLCRYLYNSRAGDREHDALLVHCNHTHAHTQLSGETVSESEDRMTDSHFIYGNNKVIVNLLAHGRIKLVRRVRSNIVSDPGRRSFQRTVCPAPDEIEVARDFALLRVAQVERANVGLD